MKERAGRSPRLSTALSRITSGLSPVKRKIARRNAKQLHRLRQAEIAFVSFSKSGRTWVTAMLSRLYHYRYGTDPSELISRKHFGRRYPELPRWAFISETFDSLGLDEASLVATFQPKKLILLTRDPRDIVASYYLQLTRRASGVTVAQSGAPEDLSAWSLYEFARNEQLGLPRIIDWMNQWEQRLAGLPGHLATSYEALRKDPGSVLQKLADFVGLECNASEIADTLRFTEFDNMKLLEQDGYFRSDKLQPLNADDPDSYKVRRGLVGGYKLDFSEDEQHALDSILAERLSRAYGYGAHASALALVVEARHPVGR
jgi:hypothetical protein